MINSSFYTENLSVDTENLIGRVAPLYKKYPHQMEPQPAYIEIDEYGNVSADYSGEIGNAEPADVWHGRTQHLSIYPYANGDTLAEFLNREGVIELLERIHAGHTIEWDGNDMVGILDDDAKAAHDTLQDMIDCEFSAETEWNCGRVCEAGDWISEDYSIAALIEAGSVEDYADEFEPDESEKVEIDGDLCDAVAELTASNLENRDDIRNQMSDDDALEAAQILVDYDSAYKPLLEKIKDDIEDDEDDDS